MSNSMQSSGYEQPWVRELGSRFNDLLALRHGWDGYTGCPVSPSIVQIATDLLQRLYVAEVPAPQMVPSADGTLQLEWHINGYDLEIDITEPLKISAMLSDHINGNEEEIEVGEDFTQLVQWVRMLGKDRANSQSAEE